MAENRQGDAVAVGFTAVGEEERKVGQNVDALRHHEESKKTGNSVRTMIIVPERQAGQAAGLRESGRAGLERGGVTWSS